MIKVGINGYGTIGKRVAEAVTLQDDMEIVGIVKTKPTYEMRGAIDANYPVFASTQNKIPFFESKGIEVSGVTEDLVDIADIIIDQQDIESDNSLLLMNDIRGSFGQELLKKVNVSTNNNLINALLEQY